MLFLSERVAESIEILYRCELYDRLYADWQRVDREALADGATTRTESPWLSASRQPALFKDPT